MAVKTLFISDAHHITDTVQHNDLKTGRDDLKTGRDLSQVGWKSLNIWEQL